MTAQVLPAAPVPFRSSPELELAARFLAGGAVAAAAVPWQGLREADVRAVREWARESLSGLAAARVLRALRAAVLGGPGFADEPPRACCFRLSRERAATAFGPAPRAIRRLLEACDSDASPAGSRDGLLVALLALAGLRSADVASLSLADYDAVEASLRVRMRKPRAGRLLLLSPENVDRLEAWLAWDGRTHGPLLTSLDSRGRPLAARALGPGGIALAVRRRGLESGLRALTPGDLRRAFLRDLRREAFEAGLTPRMHFGIGEDGEPLLVYAVV
jgi:integrase